MPETSPRKLGNGIDLTDCDREPIHALGLVQSYGCLIATSHDWMVAHASMNSRDVLGLAAEKIVGLPLTDFIPAEAVHAIRSKMQVLGKGTPSARIFGLDIFGDGRRFDVSVHMGDRHFLIEFEPSANGSGNDRMTFVQPLIARIRARGTIDEMCAEAVRCLKILSGFGRVMAYRFLENGAGRVVAEAADPGLEPYLDLHYPASDIPQQARELYRRNPIRLIADVDAPPHSIYPELDPQGRPLDLSHAVTRAVSPIHLQYLRNMGVGSSMSVSILSRGELWGLFACHHAEPHYVDFETRTAIELFGQLFSYELAQCEAEIAQQDAERARQLHDKVMTRVSGGDGLVEGFEALAAEIREVIPFDGFALYADGGYLTLGLTPNRQEFLGLARFLNTLGASEIFSTDNLAGRYPGAIEFGDRVAGLLALPISRSPRDYIVLFRGEVRKTVTWAGNPDKPVEAAGGASRLTPRKSFEAWTQEVEGHSIPWTKSERRAAESLRITLLEVVLKITDEAVDARRRGQEQQELLIAELNHRVRNILNLIRALVAQGRSGAETIEEYTVDLDRRIDALARAHDQLTANDWTSFSVHELMAVEIQAYLSDPFSRVEISGPDAALAPEALSTVALVVHELVTNSAKYGALADTSGRVSVTTAVTENGDLLIQWREEGGPPVKAPNRRGFGTTIIEQSIPYELQGTAELRFRVTGLEADFRIPSDYVSVDRPSDRSERPVEPKRGGLVAVPKLTGEVLVVEDNMIIAMEAADLLTGMGASLVHTAGNVAKALELVDNSKLSFALLDVNLGAETSQAVAEALKAADIPFALATGYGERAGIAEAFPQVRILKKPYTQQGLAQLLSELFPQNKG